MKFMGTSFDKASTVLCALLLGGSLSVLAGPPFVTDDPEPVVTGSIPAQATRLGDMAAW